jgi:hypothetical protein
MKIRRVRLEIREFVLCATVTKQGKADFHALSPKEQLKELQSTAPRRVLNLFKNLKQKDPEVVNAMLKRCPSIIEHIKRPTVSMLKRVLDSHPHALNKIPNTKRTEDLVIQAIRPEKRHLFGARDERANALVKNVSALHPNTTFTPRVYHEVVRLMCGAPEKTVKKLISTLEKQKKKIPDELRTMISRIKSKALSSEQSDREENLEISIDKTKSIVRVLWSPYTITVAHPDKPNFNHEYYIGDKNLFSTALSLQYKPSEFVSFVKTNKFPVRQCGYAQQSPQIDLTDL